MIRHVSNGYVSRAEMARHSRVSGMSSLERRGYAKDVSLNFMCSRNTSHHVSILTVLKQPFIFGVNRVGDCPDMTSPDRITISSIENRPLGGILLRHHIIRKSKTIISTGDQGKEKLPR